MTEEIVLTLPRQRRFYDVAHLVVGGLAARLDLTMDSLSDLQAALDGLLPREEADDGEVTVVLRLDGDALNGRIGPFQVDALRRSLVSDGDGFGTDLVLKTVFESYRVDEDDRDAWVAFTMRLASKEDA